jgi:hypothetical protein
MMQRYRRLVVLQPDWERLRCDFRRGPSTYARLFALLEEQYAQRHGKPRWGDKSLNTERYAEQLFAAYPGARVLHMLRDPRDRYASSKTRWQVRRGGVGAGTAEWLTSARWATRSAHRFPDQYRVVRYETLVTYPERTVREICGFIGEEYAPDMLSLAGVPKFRDHGNSSYGGQPTGGISSSSIGRYRNVLSARDVACIQLLAGNEMNRYAYEPDDVGLSLGGRVLLAVENLPVELARLLAWRAREARRNRKGRPVPSYRLVEPAAA